MAGRSSRVVRCWAGAALAAALLAGAAVAGEAPKPAPGPEAAVVRPGPGDVRVHPAGGAEVVRLRRGADGALSKVRFDAGFVVAPHRHEVERETIYVLSGGGTMTLDGDDGGAAATPHEIRAGDFVDVAPGRRHAFVAGPAGCEVLQLYLPGGPDAKYDGWVAKGGAGRPK